MAVRVRFPSGAHKIPLGIASERGFCFGIKIGIFAPKCRGIDGNGSKNGQFDPGMTISILYFINLVSIITKD